MPNGDGEFSKAGFQALRCWQEAVKVRRACREIADRLPITERFGLADQLRRAASSIAANIAEGYARRSPRECAYFLDVARASVQEVENHLLEARDVGFAPAGDLEAARLKCRHAARLITAYMRAMGSRDDAGRRNG